MDDRHWMAEALELARGAAADGEVPVGCVITIGDRVVGRGRNRRETGKTALAHAELEAIAEACRTLGGWRLWQCELFVTLEPCPMCSGAIVNGRVDRVVYGCPDVKAGGAESIFNIITNPNLNHCAEVVSGVCEEECAQVMKEFFQRRRRENKQRKQNLQD